MGKTDDYVIILALLGVGYMIVSTPITRQIVYNSVKKRIIEPTIVRSGKTLPVTSGVWSFLNLTSHRVRSNRSRYTVG